MTDSKVTKRSAKKQTYSLATANEEESKEDLRSESPFANSDVEMDNDEAYSFEIGSDQEVAFNEDEDQGAVDGAIDQSTKRTDKSTGDGSDGEGSNFEDPVNHFCIEKEIARQVRQENKKIKRA